MKRNYLYFGAALLLLAGCNADQLTRQQAEDGLVAVKLSVSLDAGSGFTRTTSDLHTEATGFTVGETMQVFMKNGESTTNKTYKVSSVTADDPVVATLAANDAADPLYYPTGTTGSVSLYAVYPEGITQGGSHIVEYDQTGETNYQTSDLMYSSAKEVALSSKTTQQALNAFSHQLVRLKLNIVKGTGVNKITEVKMVNVKRKVTVSALSDEDITVSAGVTPTEETGDNANVDEILIFSGENTSTDAQTYYVVFPKQADAGSNDWDGTNFITVTADGQSAPYTLTKEFTAGDGYELTLNVNAAALNATTTITDWGNGGSDTGSAGVQTSFSIADVGNQEYTGSAITLESGALTVTYNGRSVASDNYDVVYSDNIIPGTATVTVIGKNDYAGIYGVKPFTINPSLLTIANVTSAHKGWVIANDGHIYHCGEALAADGKTGVAMIISTYNGNVSPYNHCLAVALQDVDDNTYAWGGYGVRCLGGSDKTTSPISGLISDRDGVTNTQTLVNNSPENPAANAANSMNTTYPAPTSFNWYWHLPTCGEWVELWNSFGAGITGSENLGSIYTDATWNAYQNMRTAFLNAGGSIMGYHQYWLGTESDTENSIYSSMGRGFHMGCPHKNHQMHVRAFLAF